MLYSDGNTRTYVPNRSTKIYVSCTFYVQTKFENDWWKPVWVVGDTNLHSSFIMLYGNGNGVT